MNKTFFDYFGGRKNFNFILCFLAGFVLAILGKVDGREFLLLMLPALGINGYYNVKDKEVLGYPETHEPAEK